MFVPSFYNNLVKQDTWEIKDYVTIEGRNFFDLPVKNKDIQKFSTGRRNDYRIGYILNYPYFKQNTSLLKE